MSSLWIVFCLYLAMILLLGELAGRLKVRSLDEYLLSGRRQGTAGTAATIAATVIGAGSTLGAAGVAYFVGLSAGWYLLSAVPGLLLLGLTLAPAIRRLAVYTVPEYLERRYGPAAGGLAALLGVLALVLFLAAQLYAMGRLLAELTGLAPTVALVLSAITVVLYTWRGGNWAVHWSDSLQLVWIYAGILIATAAGLRAVGGLGELSPPPPAAGFEALGATWFHPLTRRSVSGWDPLALGNTVVAWIIMSTTWHFAMQSTAQRVLAARDPGVARRACLLAAAAIVPLAILVGLSGMTARVLDPALAPTRGAEQVAALPALISGVVSPLFGGVVLAALVAVIMSTCDSALLGASTVVVRDLLPRVRPTVRDDLAAIRLTRHLVLGIGVLALAGALVAPGLVRMLELVAAIYGVALFGPLIVGLFWRGVTQAGAVAAMVSSGAVGVGWRGLGLEAATGIHMLNLCLPVSLFALVLISLHSRSR